MVSCEGQTFALQGRRSVFSRVSDFSYAPRDAEVTVASKDGGVFAVPSARCANRLEPRYGPAEDVPVELRGAGQASRQVNNFCSPGAFECDKLIAVEVLTPGGNWSSYPPHKHDETRQDEAELEEIYYFETPGLAYQRVYGTPGRPIDVLAEVGHRRRGAHPARLARAVDRRPRLRPVLPQRHGGPGGDARLALLRRPGPRVDPRHLGGPADRPPAADELGRGKGEMTVRLTVAQALVRFLANQYSERDGVRHRLIEGCFGIFGHGNVAGVGQALLQAHVTGEADLRYYLARNEQAMVHASVGFARMRNRLATTLALPQDVQAEAHDWPEDLFTERTWYVPRPLPEPAALSRAAEVLRSARRPLVIAGGGVIYSEAGQALLRFAEATGIGVSDTQAGKGALAWDHPCAVGGVGATGSPVANALAREADVVLGVGTRYSDFTTASRTAFGHPDVKFVNLNIAAFDAGKHAGAALVADARAGLEALTEALAGYHVEPGYTAAIEHANAGWRQTVDHA